MVAFQKEVSKGRFRRIIIPVRTRFRSIEHVAGAKLVPNVFGKPR